jgi:hypothetical protein
VLEWLSPSCVPLAARLQLDPASPTAAGGWPWTPSFLTPCAPGAHEYSNTCNWSRLYHVHIQLCTEEEPRLFMIHGNKNTWSWSKGRSIFLYTSWIPVRCYGSQAKLFFQRRHCIVTTKFRMDWCCFSRPRTPEFWVSFLVVPVNIIYWTFQRAHHLT